MDVDVLTYHREQSHKYGRRLSGLRRQSQPFRRCRHNRSQRLRLGSWLCRCFSSPGFWGQHIVNNHISRLTVGFRATALVFTRTQFSPGSSGSGTSFLSTETPLDSWTTACWVDIVAKGAVKRLGSGLNGDFDGERRQKTVEKTARCLDAVNEALMSLTFI
jgi:hypothetical protein